MDLEFVRRKKGNVFTGRDHNIPGRITVCELDLKNKKKNYPMDEFITYDDIRDLVTSEDR